MLVQRLTRTKPLALLSNPAPAGNLPLLLEVEAHCNGTITEITLSPAAPLQVEHRSASPFTSLHSLRRACMDVVVVEH